MTTFLFISFLNGWTRLWFLFPFNNRSNAFLVPIYFFFVFVIMIENIKESSFFLIFMHISETTSCICLTKKYDKIPSLFIHTSEHWFISHLFSVIEFVIVLELCFFLLLIRCILIQPRNHPPFNALLPNELLYYSLARTPLLHKESSQ